MGKNYLPRSLFATFQKGKKTIILWHASLECKRIQYYFTNFAYFIHGKILNCYFDYFLSNGFFSDLRGFHFKNLFTILPFSGIGNILSFCVCVCAWWNVEIGNIHMEKVRNSKLRQFFFYKLSDFPTRFKIYFELGDFLPHVRWSSITCQVRRFSKWVVHAFLASPQKKLTSVERLGRVYNKSIKTWKWQVLD